MSTHTPATDLARVLTAERGRTFHDGTDWRAEYDRLLSALTTAAASSPVAETTADAPPTLETLVSLCIGAALFCDERIDTAGREGFRWLAAHIPALLDAQRDAEVSKALQEAEAYIARLREPLLWYWGTTDPGLLKEQWEEAGNRKPTACRDCGLAYGEDGWIECVLANDVWARISPSGDEGGILCITCISRRLKRLGLDNVPVMLCGMEAITPVPNKPHDTSSAARSPSPPRESELL